MQSDVYDSDNGIHPPADNHV